MTDPPGVMEDLDDPATLHRELDPVRTRALLASGPEQVPPAGLEQPEESALVISS